MNTGHTRNSTRINETTPLTLSCVDLWNMRRCACTEIQQLPHAILRHQWESLCATLKYAHTHSVHYHNTLAGHSLSPTSSEELAKLPFTTAEDLTHWQQFLCISQNHVERLVRLDTSGTTAPPKRLAFSHNDLLGTQAFFSIGMRQLLQKGDTLLVLLPGAMRPNGVADLLRQALQEHHIHILTADPKCEPQHLIPLLQEHPPHCLVASPTQIIQLVQLVQTNILQPSLLRHLHGILSSTEPLSPAIRNAAYATLLNTPPNDRKLPSLLLDHYGMTESGFGGGVECPAQQGYHMRWLDMYIEIIHPITLEALPAGETGEIVLTTLTREAMPLIRYRTGDASRILSSPCQCGSPLPRLDNVKGRIVRTQHAYRIEPVTKGIFHAHTSSASL